MTAQCPWNLGHTWCLFALLCWSRNTRVTRTSRCGFRDECFSAFEPVLAGAKSFMEGIALSGRRRGIGVDMAQEERIARAATTRVALLSQRDALVGIAQRSKNTDLALKAREMLGALERLG